MGVSEMGMNTLLLSRTAGRGSRRRFGCDSHTQSTPFIQSSLELVIGAPQRNCSHSSTTRHPWFQYASTHLLSKFHFGNDLLQEPLSKPQVAPVSAATAAQEILMTQRRSEEDEYTPREARGGGKGVRHCRVGTNQVRKNNEGPGHRQAIVGTANLAGL